MSWLWFRVIYIYKFEVQFLISSFIWSKTKRTTLTRMRSWNSFICFAWLGKQIRKEYKQSAILHSWRRQLTQWNRRNKQNHKRKSIRSTWTLSCTTQDQKNKKSITSCSLAYYILMFIWSPLNQWAKMLKLSWSRLMVFKCKFWSQ